MIHFYVAFQGIEAARHWPEPQGTERVPPFRLCLNAQATVADHPLALSLPHSADLLMNTITALVVRVIGFCAHYAWLVIARGGAVDRRVVLVCGDAFCHHHRHQSADLVRHPLAPTRSGVQKAFPQFELIVAVIDAPTPEQSDEATTALVARLAQQKDLFPSIQQPRGGEFFDKNGLLFEPLSISNRN